ncbi:MAG: dihydrolipoyllysine-residue succinyltransferase [Crocinitomicaceae bacterium]|nr:dihydrolipoyllysine-residue succinyltransferase [Crocinitomicaceae bacterium]|tara:strand:- start:787 stop:2082 length:1296 start_codon:yes stop_codon:yes gene_type:complete
MPILEMKVPSPGESISEVEIAAWLVSDGDYVEKDQAIAEVDSDKATLELPAELAGVITLKAEEGDVIAVGDVCCLIDTDAERPEGLSVPMSASKPAPAPKEEKKEAVTPAPDLAIPASTPPSSPQKGDRYASGHASPAAKKMMTDKGIAEGAIAGTGKDGRVLKQDVLAALAAGFDPASAFAKGGWTGSREVRRERMSMLRRKVADRLVGVKNDTAMLTTFNEVDMKPIMDLRAKYKNKFKEAKGVGLGFMGFFTKAVTTALVEYPGVNAMIDGKDVIFHDYADICIAVSSPKGLMVPVVRNAESMSIAEIEAEIKRLAIRARDGVLTVDEMQGGTFTITNGGVFGSMLSTPIINPPQSAILGMHNIVERPVAIDGKIEIRPIMYVALSYDHRIVDGKESVGFLYMVKELLENPEKIIFGGKEPHEVLLGL